MTGLPFTDPIAAPAVRTPELKIAGQAGGGPGGLASAAGALLGESPGADAWSSYLLAMRLTLGSGAVYRLPEPTRIADREVGRRARRDRA